MRTINKLFSKLLILVLLISLFGCSFAVNSSTKIKNASKSLNTIAAQEYPVKLTKLYEGKTVVTVNPLIARYIKNANNVSFLAETLFNRKKDFDEERAERLDYQCIKIEWEDTGIGEQFTIHFADNIDFNNEFTYSTRSHSIYSEVGFFVPGKTYYYKVVGSISGESKVDSFIPNPPVRYISADKVLNMRDMGGWTTKDGKTINYEKLYRGAALNEEPHGSYLSDEARKVFEYLDIKGEIDLRGNDLVDSEKNDLDVYINKINPEYPILRDGLVYFSYEYLTTKEQAAKNNLPKIFEFLADESNYPIFFHCSVGADRTGTLAYIIEALLGVDLDTIFVDFELTSFTINAGGIRARSIIANKNNEYYFQNPSIDDLGQIGRLWYGHSLLMDKYKDYSDDLQKVMEKYLIDMEVNPQDISKFKEIMLG